MKEYIFEIEEEEIDEAEVFVGWIRNHSRELIRCKECKYWCSGDMFTPIEGISYHSCWILIGIGVKDNEALVPYYHYCGWAERKEE